MLSPCERFMMRATPYCSVRPMAVSAYMPPTTAPVMKISIRRDMLAFPLPDTEEGSGWQCHPFYSTWPPSRVNGRPYTASLVKANTQPLMLRNGPSKGSARGNPSTRAASVEAARLRMRYSWLLPGGLRHDRGACAVLLWRDAVEVVALPLPDRPDALVQVV